MVGIKPDEISAILKQQLTGVSTAAELEEVGTVLQVGDGIARIYGLTGVQAGELVAFENGVSELRKLMFFKNIFMICVLIKLRFIGITL